MKKTIIAFLAISGVALGETYTLDTMYTKGETSGSLFDVRSDESLNEGIYTGSLLGARANFTVLIDVDAMYSSKSIDKNTLLQLTTLTYAGHGSGWFTGDDRYVTISNGSESVKVALASPKDSQKKWEITLNFETPLTFGMDDTLEMTVTSSTSGQNVDIWTATPSEGVTISGASIDGNTGTFAAIRMIATTAPIPEPTTATLSLLALAGLAARRRRR